LNDGDELRLRKPLVIKIWDIVSRYDLIATSTTRPSLTTFSSLLRLFAVVAGVLAIAARGYLRLRP
jgi:hypothetical protein